MLKELKNNNHGVVFITVLIVIITTMVLAISALSLNISQIRSTEIELKYIQAKVIADGGLSRIITLQFDPAQPTTDPFVEVLGNTTFTISSDITAGAPQPGSETTPLDIVVSFP